uniref:Uncharacterized protein n=1 Tax=Lactuca sativa TaxID=4236 RepID=A0A9R1WU53_LACSA|nr:hypothetical protein LSAT_V11C900473970 [Lactuca sativa]
MPRNGRRKRKQVLNLPTQSVQEIPTKRLNNRTSKHISTSTMIRSISKTSNLFVDPNEDGDVEPGITKNDGNTIGDSNKNRYGNHENESGRPQLRRFGAIFRDEGVRLSPMYE